MIKKVKNKLQILKSKYGQIIKTYFKKSQRQSDINRWSQQKSLFSTWDERTQLLANQVFPNSKVFEFGAARLVLKNMLPNGCTYLHSDIVKRNQETLVADLNKELPELQKVDYIVFSGVLEYLFEVKKIINHLSQFTTHFLFSYATTNNYSNISDRRYHGWVSDLSEADIFTIAIALNLQCKIIEVWKNQTLFQFSK